MTRDPEKLQEYRERYNEKLKTLGVKSLGIRVITSHLKCFRCKLGFAPKDKKYRKKGRVIKYYHQECWDGMQY